MNLRGTYIDLFAESHLKWTNLMNNQEALNYLMVMH